MKLMIFDGNSIANRAFYGIRPLTTRDGLYTHAVYGFLMTLLRLREEEQPDAVCVAFDVHAPTFRHRAEESYKATRKAMPEELSVQMPVLKEVLDDLKIPRYEKEGWEADDLIGTVSRRCEQAGWDCVVVTGDRDSLQLISGHTRVKLVSTRMGQTVTKNMDEAAFREEYGFEPALMVDLKALMGDASDNIPGVPGVGEKTALELVRKFGSVDSLYKALPEAELKPAVLRKLTEGRESAEKSHYLATIVTDVPLDFQPEDNLLASPKPEAYDLFLRLEFSKLIEKFHLRPGEAASGPTPVVFEGTCSLETVTESARAEELLALWRKRDHISLLALPSLDGVAVEWGEESEGRCAVIHRSGLTDYTGFIKALFSGDIPKVSHNVKDLMRALLEEGFPAEGFVFDTALAAYLLDATAGSYDLPRLAVMYFNYELPPEKTFADPDAFSLLGDSAAALGAWARHAATVEGLYGTLPGLLKERGQWDLYGTAELPLCRVLAEMERTGCRVDSRALKEFGDLLSARMADQEKTIYELAGVEFNINSPKQLGEILFERLQLPHGKKTKTGWSTNADVLEKLQHPVVDAVLEYRQYAKLKSTYADGLLKAIGPDGRIHTSFQMTVTATGRLSSTEPNLQNIPTRTDLGSEIRKMFVPAEGNVLVDADYSQIELRLLAHIADDKAMQEAFSSGTDIHTATASQVFGVPPEQVSHEMRRRAKAVNFGIVYGISAFSLSQDIGVAQWEAKEYMDSYFAKFPGVRRYMTEIVERAKREGYVETLFHRRRALPELTSSNHNLRAFGERVALNMPIQGTAADIMKLAMVAVAGRLKREQLQARLVLQVHDELIVECPEEEAPRVETLLTEEMAGVARLAVPLTAEAHTGKNWLEAKE